MSENNTNLKLIWYNVFKGEYSMIFRETERTELKRVLNDSFIKEVVAFLNSMDGIIYIGVEDDGTAIGVVNLDETLRSIADIITTQILPNPQEYIKIGTVYENGNHVIEVSVKKGSGLYYIKKYGRSSAGCFIRIGTSARSMTEEQIENEFTANAFSNVKIVDVESRNQNLSFRYLKMLFTDKGLSVNEETFEQNAKLRTKNDQYNIQADLLSDENDYSIKVVKFDGDTKASNIVLRNEYGYKCLIVAMQQAYEYCADVINQTKTEFSNGIRKDIKLFDKEAFREAWFNACLHNDWLDGTPPAIYIFNDRLEIISTGGLPYNMTKQDFFSGISRPVNEILARIFIQLGLIEQTGHGVSMVTKQYGREAFEFMDNFLRVTIPFNYKLEENKQGVPENVPENVPEKNTTELVFKYIQVNPNITTIELAEKLLKNRRTITRAISLLKKQNKIKRIGSDKAGHWEVIDK